MASNAPTTIKVVSLWCFEANHDKLYRLEMTEMNGRYDVFGVYGRRGGKMTIAIKVEGVDLRTAQQVFNAKWKDEIRKGYREIVEDVMEVGKTRPTVRNF